MLTSFPLFALTIDNAPELKVLSGSDGAVAAALAELSARVPAVRAVVLHVNRAFHSPFMKAPAVALVAAAEGITLSLPSLPMTSNVTGGWITEDDLSAEYWGRHMAGAVRWQENAQCLLRWKVRRASRLLTVTFHANPSHSLTRSPSYLHGHALRCAGKAFRCP